MIFVYELSKAQNFSAYAWASLRAQPKQIDIYLNENIFLTKIIRMKIVLIFWKSSGNPNILQLQNPLK